MRVTQFLLAELESESTRSRRALEQIPDGKQDWAPNERSMKCAHLADMVANIPTWVVMIINQDQLDVNPPAGSRPPRATLNTSADYVAALDTSMAAARAALTNTTDKHLRTPWRLLSGGKVVSESAREVVVRDTINHWVHHRGQMTVYLRLMGAKVPALYGASADDLRFD